MYSASRAADMCYDVLVIICFMATLQHAVMSLGWLADGCRPSPMKIRCAGPKLVLLVCDFRTHGPKRTHVVQAYESGASILFAKNYYVRFGPFYKALQWPFGMIGKPHVVCMTGMQLTLWHSKGYLQRVPQKTASAFGMGPNLSFNLHPGS